MIFFLEIAVPDNPEAKNEILPISSSISSVDSATDVLCAPTVYSIASVPPAANAKSAVIPESEAELVSPKLSEIVAEVVPSRLKAKGPKGRKVNKQYSKTIEEVVKESIGK